MQVMVAYSNGETSEVEYMSQTAQAAVANLTRQVNNGVVRWFAIVGAGQPTTVSAFGALLDANR